MTSTSNMNIIMGQGTKISEIHNVKKQNLELSQQFVAQKAEDEKKKDKTKVQRFGTQSRIEADKEKQKQRKEKGEGDKKGARDNAPKDQFKTAEGSLIDIRV